MGKFYIKFIILLFLYNCSYQPIFNDKQYNFEFKNIYLSGQDHISNLLKKELEKINGEKKYDISIFAEKNRIILSGNPISPNFHTLYQKNKNKFLQNVEMKILILGGSQGSKSLNLVLPKVFFNIEDLFVKHQCGKNNSEETEIIYQKHDNGKNKIEIIKSNNFYNTGFALVYNNDLYKNKIITFSFFKQNSAPNLARNSTPKSAPKSAANSTPNSAPN